MQSKTFTLISAVVLLVVFSATSAFSQTGCCPSPDSLRVVAFQGDSAFCVRWKVSDSVHCDTPQAGQLQYRPIGTTTWTKATFLYKDSLYYTKCDTALACVKYEWRVRNICVKNGDTIATAWVLGPSFTMPCDSAARSTTASLSLYPNPAKSTIMLEGKFSGVSRVIITISDMNGYPKFRTQINLLNDSFKLQVNVSTWNNGIYFITVTDGKISKRYSFIKQ